MVAASGEHSMVFAAGDPRVSPGGDPAPPDNLEKRGSAAAVPIYGRPELPHTHSMQCGVRPGGCGVLR